MSKHTAEVVICGAGIAGIAAAYHLAVRHGLTDVVLVDERPPLSLTRDRVLPQLVAGPRRRHGRADEPQH